MNQENDVFSESKLPGLEDQAFATPNMPACIERLDAIFASNSRKNKGSVLKLHLENFKVFNDTFGYLYSDLLLKEIYQYLKSIEKAEVFRYTGIDFVIILEGMNYSQTMQVVETLQDRFEQHWRINDMDCMCVFNLGAIFYPGLADLTPQLLGYLDQAVNAAAKLEQNQVVVYDSELHNKLYRKSSIANSLKEAINEGALELRFRPTYRVEKNKFTRAESFLRLFSKEFGIISQTEFIPIAEDSGLICAIDNYVIHMVCQTIKTLLEEGKDFESLAVPISPIQFLQEHFCEQIAKTLEEYQIPASKLAFEITEGVLISSFPRVNIVMQELSDMGIEFILSEFGTGYSGINNILYLPVDVLKLSRTFVLQLDTDERSSVLIEGLIGIANKAGFKLIAEGVETEHQVELLKQYGCQYEQGFYYSSTVTTGELKALFS